MADIQQPVCTFYMAWSSAAGLVSFVVLPLLLWAVPSLILLFRSHYDQRRRRLLQPAHSGAVRYLAGAQRDMWQQQSDLPPFLQQLRCDSANDRQPRHPDASSSSFKLADPTAIDGFTALHAACVSGNESAASWLLSRGARHDACRDDGWNHTPLHYAAAGGHANIVKKLLDAGADPMLRDAFGRTPIMIARAHIRDAMDEAEHYTTSDHVRHVRNSVASHARVCELLTVAMSSPASAEEDEKLITYAKEDDNDNSNNSGSKSLFLEADLEPSVRDSSDVLVTILEDAVLDTYRIAQESSSSSSSSSSSTFSPSSSIPSSAMNTARTHLSDDNTSSPPPLRETTGMLETLLEDVVLDTFRALVFQDTTGSARRRPPPSPPRSPSEDDTTTLPQHDMRGGGGGGEEVENNCSLLHLPNSVLDCETGEPRQGSETDDPFATSTAPAWQTAARLAVVIHTACGSIYLAYRCTCTIAPNVFSVVFLCAESLLFYGSFVFFCVELWSMATRRARHTADMRKHSIAEGTPTVDVVIPCLSEPIAVIEETTRAAMNIRSPFAHHSPSSPPSPSRWGMDVVVHVLDDGARDDVAMMCEHLRRHHGGHRLRYHRRPKKWLHEYEDIKDAPAPPHHHAKAGNINHALMLGALRGDYMLCLDSDMVPRRDALQRVLPHFFTLVREKRWALTRDEYRWHARQRTAYVQCPQDFYNVGALDAVGHRSSFFYEVLAKGRTGASGCVPCVGTNVVFQRSALVSIGGQALHTVTEDHATSLVLARSGFSAVFASEHVANGLAPDTIQDTFKQRRRWAVGSLQLLLRYDPLTDYALPYSHRAIYGSSSLVYLTWIVYVSLMLAPLLFLWARVAPFGNGIFALTDAVMSVHDSVISVQEHDAGVTLMSSANLPPTALFLAAFLPYFLMNRVALFAACAASNASLRRMLAERRGVEKEEKEDQEEQEGPCGTRPPPLYRSCRPSLDLWRGWQMSIYMIPTYANACIVFLYHEIVRPAFSVLCCCSTACCQRRRGGDFSSRGTNSTIAFDVTRKNMPSSRASRSSRGGTGAESGHGTTTEASASATTSGIDEFAPVLWRQALACTWPHICAVMILLGGLAYGIYGIYADPRKGGAIGLLSAGLWGVLIIFLVWPPLATLVPSITCCCLSSGDGDEMEETTQKDESVDTVVVVTAEDAHAEDDNIHSIIRRSADDGHGVISAATTARSVISRRQSGAGRVHGVVPFAELTPRPMTLGSATHFGMHSTTRATASCTHTPRQHLPHRPRHSSSLWSAPPSPSRLPFAHQSTSVARPPAPMLDAMTLTTLAGLSAGEASSPPPSPPCSDDSEKEPPSSDENTTCSTAPVMFYVANAAILLALVALALWDAIVVV